MCRPRLRWTLQHSSQIKTPRFTDAHSGPVFKNNSVSISLLSTGRHFSQDQTQRKSQFKVRLIRGQILYVRDVKLTGRATIGTNFSRWSELHPCRHISSHKGTNTKQSCLLDTYRSNKPEQQIFHFPFFLIHQRYARILLVSAVWGGHAFWISASVVESSASARPKFKRAEEFPTLRALCSIKRCGLQSPEKSKGRIDCDFSSPQPLETSYQRTFHSRTK